MPTYRRSGATILSHRTRQSSPLQTHTTPVSSPSPLTFSSTAKAQASLRLRFCYKKKVLCDYLHERAITSSATTFHSHTLVHRLIQRQAAAWCEQEEKGPNPACLPRSVLGLHTLSVKSGLSVNSIAATREATVQTLSLSVQTVGPHDRRCPAAASVHQRQPVCTAFPGFYESSIRTREPPSCFRSAYTLA